MLIKDEQHAVSILEKVSRMGVSLYTKLFIPSRSRPLSELQGNGNVSISDRRQIGAHGLIIETNGYEICLADYSEPLVQAPAKQISVA